MKYCFNGIIIIAVVVNGAAAWGEQFLVIAHRGACGYAPEHTLVATALAIGMGADYVEQDVVLTKDGQPVVLHDIHLDTVTNVAQQFPARSRSDGRFYAIDFTLAEIKTLSVHERIDWKSGKPIFPNRFPHSADALDLQVPTLAEAIEMIQGINNGLDKEVGIYPEIKKPAWHRAAGHDISATVLRVLAEYGYDQPEDRVFLQCFDATELRRIRNDLGCKLRLVQLIGENRWNESKTDFARLRSAQGLQQIATYAQGIGPRIEHVLSAGEQGGLVTTDLVEKAHNHGLSVHPFTLRVDALPLGIPNVGQLMGALKEANCDGVFSDFPDVTRAELERLTKSQNEPADAP